jgi:phenylpyruvate tautomerase PptA (4-oxalocrotonate tautomerase family)
VLEVELIGEVASETRRGLAARIAEGVAEVLGARPQSVWVRLRYTPLADYAENGASGESGQTPLPVFVTLIKRAWADGDEMKREASALAAAVGAACHRPAEEVHLFYEPPGRGRVAFGGKLVE